MINAQDIVSVFDQLKEAREKLHNANVVLGEWKERAYAEHPDDLKHARSIEARDFAIAAIFRNEDGYSDAKSEFTSARLRFELAQDEVEKIRVLIDFGVRHEE